MTKMEEKLIELGYRRHQTYYYDTNKENKYTIYSKEYGCDLDIIIELLNNEKVDRHFLKNSYTEIEYLETIKRIKRAFNTMIKDIRELRECQD